jgi:hypothetical protein
VPFGSCPGNTSVRETNLISDEAIGVVGLSSSFAARSPGRGWVKISGGVAVGTACRAYLWLDEFWKNVGVSANSHDSLIFVHSLIRHHVAIAGAPQTACRHLSSGLAWQITTSP